MAIGIAYSFAVRMNMPNTSTSENPNRNDSTGAKYSLMLPLNSIAPNPILVIPITARIRNCVVGRKSLYSRRTIMPGTAAAI